MIRAFGLGVVILSVLGVTSPSNAAKITVGNVEIAAAADQRVPIYIEFQDDDPRAAGVTFNVQVADGGPDIPGGSIVGPIITYVQLIKDMVEDPVDSGNFRPHSAYTDEFGPTLFEGRPNWGHYGVGPRPGGEGKRSQIFNENTAASSGSVVAHGLLAVITFDASEFDESDGPWDLHLATPQFSTELLDDTAEVEKIPLTITKGTISIVPIPEPATLVMLLAGGLGLLLWRRWRRA